VCGGITFTLALAAGERESCVTRGYSCAVIASGALSEKVTGPIILDYILPARAGVDEQGRAAGAAALGMVATTIIFATDPD
jgi:hypothetical protein